MIRINLLPPEARKTKQHKVLLASLKPLGIAAGVLAGSVTVGLFAVNGIQARVLSGLNAEWERLQPERAKLEDSRRVFQTLQQQVQVLHGVKNPEARWAPRLNLLSDSLVSRLWFASLRWKFGDPLRLEGSTLVASAGNPSSAPVSRFLQRLKEQPEFLQWFRQVELESVEQRQIGGEEVVDFSILLTPVG